MKKFFALMLAAVMALSLVACGSSNDAKDDQSGDQPAEITSALGILETAWNDYGDDEKFSVVGGETGENMVEDAPADYDLSDRATAEANLALPETAQVDQAATLSHALNPNTFTAAAYHATGDAKDVCRIAGDGQGLEIGFNNRYLMDALRYAPADTVRMELNTGISPAIIVPVEGEENFLYMVLPVRLKAN